MFLGDVFAWGHSQARLSDPPYRQAPELEEQFGVTSDPRAGIQKGCLIWRLERALGARAAGFHRSLPLILGKVTSWLSGSVYASVNNTDNNFIPGDNRTCLPRWTAVRNCLR